MAPFHQYFEALRQCIGCAGTDDRLRITNGLKYVIDEFIGSTLTQSCLTRLGMKRCGQVCRKFSQRQTRGKSLEASKKASKKS